VAFCQATGSTVRFNSPDGTIAGGKGRDLPYSVVQTAVAGPRSHRDSRPCRRPARHGKDRDPVHADRWSPGAAAWTSRRAEHHHRRRGRVSLRGARRLRPLPRGGDGAGVPPLHTCPAPNPSRASARHSPGADQRPGVGGGGGYRRGLERGEQLPRHQPDHHPVGACGAPLESAERGQVLAARPPRAPDPGAGQRRQRQQPPLDQRGLVSQHGLHPRWRDQLRLVLCQWALPDGRRERRR
jgi:hypothetical protein